MSDERRRRRSPFVGLDRIWRSDRRAAGHRPYRAPRRTGCVAQSRLDMECRLGTEAASEYLATYLIEKALSTDNMFIFLIVFDSLKVPTKEQHTVLFWGIAGAVGFRALLIFLGATALERWEWVTYIFGAIVLYAAYRAFQQRPGRQVAVRPAVRYREDPRRQIHRA